VGAAVDTGAVVAGAGPETVGTLVMGAAVDTGAVVGGDAGVLITGAEVSAVAGDRVGTRPLTTTVE